MGKLGSFLHTTHIFTPLIRGHNSVIFNPISKNKVYYCSGDPDETIEPPTIMVLSYFRKFQFSAPMFWCGSMPAPGVWNFENPQKS